MGCDYYWIGNTIYEVDNYVRFTEVDDTYRCLCTFPHNDGKELDIERLRSLALLGAAVALNAHGDLDLPAYLPDAVPDWIKDGIDKLIGYKEDERRKEQKDVTV